MFKHFWDIFGNPCGVLRTIILLISIKPEESESYGESLSQTCGAKGERQLRRTWSNHLLAGASGAGRDGVIIPIDRGPFKGVYRYNIGICKEVQGYVGGV